MEGDVEDCEEGGDEPVADTNSRGSAIIHGSYSSKLGKVDSRFGQILLTAWVEDYSLKRRFLLRPQLKSPHDGEHLMAEDYASVSHQNAD